MFDIRAITPPSRGLGGLDADLTEEERAMQASMHRFAEEVVRPIGIALDRMTADQAVAPDSPVCEFIEKFDTLGLPSR